VDYNSWLAIWRWWWRFICIERASIIRHDITFSAGYENPPQGLAQILVIIGARLASIGMVLILRILAITPRPKLDLWGRFGAQRPHQLADAPVCRFFDWLQQVAWAHRG
jgi:hypothetical protein